MSSGTSLADEPTTSQRLKNLLEISDKQPDVSMDTTRLSSKKRRFSRSRSSSTAHKRRRKEEPFYICPSKISEIFKGEISPKKLCSLSAIKRGTPSVVLDIIPTASTVQICQMCKLWESLKETRVESAVKAVGRSLRRRRKKHEQKQ